VVVLEVLGEEVTSELRRAPDDEGGVIFAPRDDVIRGWIVNKVVRLGQEWGRNGFMGV